YRYSVTQFKLLLFIYNSPNSKYYTLSLHDALPILILLIIFIVTAVNYADRATLSIAGTEVAKELQLSAVSMGYIFSAFNCNSFADRKSGSAGMPRPISYAVFCLKKKMKIYVLCL